VTNGGEEHDAQRPIVRDRRRIDPETGAVREEARPDADSHPPVDPGTPPDEASGDRVGALERALGELTADLQRLQAEYLNYKRRVDRDRNVSREAAVAGVLTELLPVLDDLDRAREHGELTGGFKAVADSLERAVGKFGLVRFGEVGDAFDPRWHEALAHAYSDEVSGPTCQAVLQPGYRHGERVVRPARVAVAEPTVPAVVTEETPEVAEPVADVPTDAAAEPADEGAESTRSQR
jgi:molecular chaperone GrpE